MYHIKDGQLVEGDINTLHNSGFGKNVPRDTNRDEKADAFHNYSSRSVVTTN